MSTKKDAKEKNVFRNGHKRAIQMRIMQLQSIELR